MITQRRNEYVFKNKGDLIRFFSNWLTVPQIDHIINTCENSFKFREESNRRDNKLQVLKKCEHALSREVKKVLF